MMRRRSLIVMTLLTLAGCGEEDQGPYLAYQGGGFIFNYRTAVHFYGFVAKPLRRLPEGGVLEARFEVPGRSEPIVLREPIRPGQLQYKFETPALKGIIADHPYQTSLTLYDAKGRELDRIERSFVTTLDQSKLPDEPLTTGPAYNPNPGALDP